MTARTGTDRATGVAGAQKPEPVGELTYTEASDELDVIVEELEGGVVDVDRLVARLQRATDIVDELDGRLRRTRGQVEELIPRLVDIGRSEAPGARSVDEDAGEDGLDLATDATGETWDPDIDDDSADDSQGVDDAPTGLF